MASNSAGRHSLINVGSNSPETSKSTSPAMPEITLTTIPSIPTQRHGYHRASSSQDLTDPSPRYQSPVNTSADGDLGSRGLGISDIPSRAIGSITRKPIASNKAKPSPPTPSNPYFQNPEKQNPGFKSPEDRSPERSPNTPSSTSSRTPVSPPWQRYGGRELNAVAEVDEESIGKGKMTSSFRENLHDVSNDYNNNPSFQTVPQHDDNDFDNDNISKWRNSD